MECSYVDPVKGIVYFFKSDSIWYPVEVILEKYNITTIMIYVDNRSFKKYYVDITELEKHLGN